jgi:hypothetical protein
MSLFSSLGRGRGSLCEVSSKSVFLDFMVSYGGVLVAFSSNT